jgi:uncharacterized protein YggT (Ycf19 family)
MIQALLYVLETVFGLFALAALTRFYAQAFRAPFRNPVANFVVALTDFAVKPLRRIIPGALGLDVASLVVAWLTQVLLLIAVYALVAPKVLAFGGFWPVVALLAMVKVLKLSIYLLMGVVIIVALMSAESVSSDPAFLMRCHARSCARCNGDPAGGRRRPVDLGAVVDTSGGADCTDGRLEAEGSRALLRLVGAG